MPSLVECVPNFSEGRRPDVVAAIVAQIERALGQSVLDVHRDVDHHRSVVTFVGAPEMVERAALAGVAAAVARLTLQTHVGVHPRIGVADVVPFVPVSGVTMAECVALAHRVGRRVAGEYGLPVFCYGEAACQPAYRDLAAIRRAIRTSPTFPRPDFGPAQPHPTAGAVAIGARDYLIAFNVELLTDALDVAKAIARDLRAAQSGLPGVKALGLRLASRGTVQVSMNLTDTRQTRPVDVFNAVVAAAKRHAVAVGRPELVGLIPTAASAVGFDGSCFEGALAGALFPDEKILERRLKLISDEEGVGGKHDITGKSPAAGG
ncbi:glutamate formimidoyltransferase [Chloracidobacterium validum]|uniref:glutamate formimidoyltransferase n=1 Tax=Chloracidobacterium validum TaxID=2821543 RepID=A0ABX8BCC4_9BACT|nr:glutamate formimidoyltransferase [Chloracidobacterium validum]QUW03284.1 glutamate formimidoyltransferase [Chloracidobacterium validum]